MSHEIKIQIKGLTKYYGSIRGIENISVRIPAGGVGFLGPNGAGKTTLIRTLLGIIKPTRGTATVLGYDIQHRSCEIAKLVLTFGKEKSERLTTRNVRGDKLICY